MWKILVGFVVFAALVMYMLNKSGGNIDMGGEKHGVEESHAASGPSASASSASSASSAAPASAASR